ncbi:hypothetical protein [Reichenbachiella sp.]|uniref:hypothetical protein n=1 Tax=Reichenbachiella sp. TaxID=2184521 RepID=UPI003B599D70
MITLSVFLVFSGFFSLYIGSNRVEFSNDLPFVQWFRQQSINTRGTGIALFLMSLVLSVQTWGLGAGVLFFFIQLMTLGSLIVLLVPLKVLNYKFVLSLTAICFVLEFLIY